MNVKSVIFISLTVVFSLTLSCNSTDKTNAKLNLPLAEIPITTERTGLVFVKGKINNKQKEYNFMFDTGSSTEVLDTKEAKKINFVSSGMTTNTAGAGSSQSYPIVYHKTIKLPPNNIEVNNATFAIIDLSYSSHLYKNESQGIIGYSLPARYITQVDYENKKMMLYDAIKDVDIKGYTPIPFEFAKGIEIPYINISFELQNGKNFSGKVLFDTGLDGTFIINKSFNNKHQLSEQIDKKLISDNVGISGVPFKVERVAIKSLTIGSAKINDIPVRMSYSEGGIATKHNAMGILGVGIIHKFNYILDYTKKIIYLKPNKYFEDPYQFPLTSIVLDKKNERLIVRRLHEKSPAYLAGLREGDQLISINKKQSNDMATYAKVLRGHVGDEVILSVKKPSGEEKVYTFKLKKML